MGASISARKLPNYFTQSPVYNFAREKSMKLNFLVIIC